MRICAAQTRAVTGDIPGNITNHLTLVREAISQRCDLIFFPELSITGYEPKLAESLATTRDDARFKVFQELSNANVIIIGIGVPTRVDAGIRISMIVFQPHQPQIIYSKQLLHDDELPYFIPGEKQVFLNRDDKKIAPAICYESLQPKHIKYAINSGANVYLASVAKPAKGVEKAFDYFPLAAKRYGVPVVMSNAVGFCDNFESAGNSAVWNDRGELLGQLDDKSEGLLIFDTETEEVFTA